jgi:hypothetical protein
MRRKKKYFFLLEMADEERQTPFRIYVCMDRGVVHSQTYKLLMKLSN